VTATASRRVIARSAEIERIVARLAHQILEPNESERGLVLYRDDRVTHELPDSQIPIDLSSRVVVIVDDVLYTGRTVRSALDAVTDLGRSAAIRLCVLVDRGLRELPIQADYVGRLTPTTPSERVKVTLAPQAAPTDEIVITGASGADTA
jgi:pyrimidine operon attenuation protein / uracil phosphoribosyltransferase